MSLLGEGSSIGELKVLRALSQEGATAVTLSELMEVKLVLDDRAGQLIQMAKLWVEDSGMEPFCDR